MSLRPKNFPVKRFWSVVEALWPRSSPQRWASIASISWAALVLSYGIGFLAVTSETQSRGTVFLDGIFFLAGLFLPLLLIWLAALLAGELSRQRVMIAALGELFPPLINELSSARAMFMERGTALPGDTTAALCEVPRDSETATQLDRLLTAQTELSSEFRAEIRALRDHIAAPSPPPAPAPSRQAVPPPAPQATRPSPAQEALPLLPGTEVPAGPTWSDLIRALDFPRDVDDHDGFRALKAALRNHSLAQMLQAAEDVLTILSQEGVYMEDLEPAPSSPDSWRRFIDGIRGPEVSEVGGITDARALELTSSLMKSDAIFRDTALYFQRRFDVVLSEFGSEAEDAELMQLADTRSCRAFMLLTRLGGAFE